MRVVATALTFICDLLNVGLRFAAVAKTLLSKISVFFFFNKFLSGSPNVKGFKEKFGRVGSPMPDYD